MSATETRTRAVKCSSLTASGVPCPWPTRSTNGLCLSHDPTRRVELQRRARLGGKAHAEAVRCAATPFSSASGVLDWLTREIGVAGRSGDAARARNAVALAQVVRDLLAQRDLERENAQLRALLVEHHPGLRDRLVTK